VEGPASVARRQQLKSVPSDTILYRYAGSSTAVNLNGGGGGGGAAAVGGSGAQLSSVRGRLNHYGTRRVLRMLGNYHNDI